MDALTLYHTSPEPITHIRSDGLFGDSLCFAVRPYVMTAAARPQVYRIDLPGDQIVESRGRQGAGLPGGQDDR